MGRSNLGQPVFFKNVHFCWKIRIKHYLLIRLTSAGETPQWGRTSLKSKIILGIQECLHARPSATMSKDTFLGQDKHRQQISTTPSGLTDRPLPYHKACAKRKIFVLFVCMASTAHKPSFDYKDILCSLVFAFNLDSLSW